MEIKSICKKSDWENPLIDYVNAEMGKAFEWGKTDCTTLALGALKAMCGDFDHEPLTYTTRLEAMEFMSTIKYSLYDFMRLKFDVSIPDIFYWQKGDLIFIPQAPFECIHVVLDSKALSIPVDGVVGLCNIDTLPIAGQRILRVR